MSDEKHLKFGKSFNSVLKFYAILFLIFLLSIPINYHNELGITLLIIISANFLIIFVTQRITLHIFLNEKEAKEDTAEDLLFKNFGDCVIRCSAGILEMVLYTFFFAIGLWEIVAGYLLLKGLSTWNSKSTIKKGLSTSGLRIAVVLSLLFAFWASFYLHSFLQYKYHLNRPFLIEQHVNPLNL